MVDSTLPSCIGYYGKPMLPNNCKFAPLCRCVVRKERLRGILEVIDELETQIRGAREILTRV